MRKLKVDLSLNIPYEPFYCPLSSSPQFSTLFPFLPSPLSGRYKMLTRTFLLRQDILQIKGHSGPAIWPYVKFYRI